MKKKLLLFLLSYFIIFFVFIIYINQSYKSNPKKIVFEYDSLKNGDIIPFDSTIEGNIYKFGQYTSGYDDYYYFSQKGQIQSFLKVCYCKDSSCIEKNQCDKKAPLLDLGSSNNFSYHVLSYNSIFKTSSRIYTGWEVYYVPLDHRAVYKDYGEKLFGNYYDIYLFPVSYNRNKCTLYDGHKDYYININYTSQDNDLNFKKIDDNTMYFDEEGYRKYSIKFEAKENDIITFDVKTSSPNLKVYLNDKIINDEIKLNNDVETSDSIVKYNTKVYKIDENGEYILTFEDDKLDKNSFINYYKYTYIKNIKILRPVINKEIADTYILNCNSEIIVGESE